MSDTFFLVLFERASFNTLSYSQESYSWNYFETYLFLGTQLEISLIMSLFLRNNEQKSWGNIQKAIFLQSWKCFTFFDVFEHKSQFWCQHVFKEVEWICRCGSCKHQILRTLESNINIKPFLEPAPKIWRNAKHNMIISKDRNRGHWITVWESFEQGKIKFIQ